MIRWVMLFLRVFEDNELVNWPPNVAECKAIMFAVRLAKSHGLLYVIIEYDVLAFIFKLSKAAFFFSSDLDSILGDVISFRSSFDSISFSHVKRDVNIVGLYVAHNLARAVSFDVE